MALTAKERRLVRLTAAVVSGDWAAWEGLVQSAPAGEPDRAWREAVVQCHLFCGFPKVVEALSALPAEEGLGRPVPEERLGEPELPERGRELFQRIYGDRAEGLEQFLAERHGDFAGWILGHAYGRVLTRPGLAPDRRELLAVAALAIAGPPRQLAGHVRGALRCGATLEELGQVLDELGESADGESAALARRLVRDAAS